MFIRLTATQAVCTFKLLTNLTKRLKSTHVYREVIPWNHSKDIAYEIKKNILYNNHGLIVFSKPYGVGSSDKPGAKLYANAAPVGDKTVSLYDALPYLARSLGYEDLFIAFVPDRYKSGITILTTSEKLKYKVKQSVLLSKTTDDTMNLYLAVVLGTPFKISDTRKVGIKMSSIVHNQPRIVTLSETAVKKGNMVRLVAKHNVLSSSYCASLLSIRASTDKLNSLRVYCTDVLVSPVLGDNMFGSRIKIFLGKATLIDLTNETSTKPMKLPRNILKSLQLTRGEELIIPCHLHLQVGQSHFHNCCRFTVQESVALIRSKICCRTTTAKLELSLEVHLTDFAKKDIILRAPLPPVFQWTCEQLGLEVPPCGSCEEVQRKEKRKGVQEVDKAPLELPAF